MLHGSPGCDSRMGSPEQLSVDAVAKPAADAGLRALQSASTTCFSSSAGGKGLCVKRAIQRDQTHPLTQSRFSQHFKNVTKQNSKE